MLGTFFVCFWYGLCVFTFLPWCSFLSALLLQCRLRVEMANLKAEAAQQETLLSNAKQSWQQVNQMLVAENEKAEQSLVEAKIKYAEAETEREQLKMHMRSMRDEIEKLKEEKMAVARRMTQLEVRIARGSLVSPHSSISAASPPSSTQGGAAGGEATAVEGLQEVAGPAGDEKEKARKRWFTLKK